MLSLMQYELSEENEDSQQGEGKQSEESHLSQSSHLPKDASSQQWSLVSKALGYSQVQQKHGSC